MTPILEEWVTQMRPQGRRFGDLVTRLLLFVIVAGVVLAIFYPFVWLVLASFKSNAEIYKPGTFLPSTVRWENYVRLFQLRHFGRSMLNSLLVSLVYLVLTLFFCSLAGYAFAKFPEAPGRDALFNLLLATMMVPTMVTIIPAFLVLRLLGGLNTYWALILPNAANAFGIFLMRQYVQAIPDELLDAARIDGCTSFGVYYRVILPLIRPALAVYASVALIAKWNEFLWPLMVVSRSEMFTIPIALANFWLGEGYKEVGWGGVMAACTLATVPMLLILVLFQRAIVRGLLRGALK